MPFPRHERSESGKEMDSSIYARLNDSSTLSGIAMCLHRRNDGGDRDAWGSSPGNLLSSRSQYVSAITILEFIKSSSLDRRSQPLRSRNSRFSAGLLLWLLHTDVTKRLAQSVSRSRRLLIN